MESNCQNKEKEFEVLIDHQHGITAEQLNRISICGGWRGEKDRQRRLISILYVPILSIVLEFGNHALKILTNGSVMVAERQGKSRNYVNKKKKTWLFYKIEGGCDGNFY